MEDKHPLQQAIEDTDRKCRSYSGRGMYGRTCLSVEISRHESLGDMLADIIENTDEDNQREIADGFRDMCWDNMGLDMVYYFANVSYVGDEDEDEDAA